MITTQPIKGAQAYTVLRALCMAGQRVEPGQAVTLTPQQAVELAAAGKVSHTPVADLGAEIDPALGPQTRARKSRAPDA